MALGIAGGLAVISTGGVAADGVVTLSVPGRVNSEPGIAAAGQTVAVVWGASTASASDVYVAVSRDGGLSFGPPVHVNDLHGTARVTGEQAPRVAVTLAGGRGAAPTIVVAWAGREPAQTVRVARSIDGGKTFQPSQAVQGDRAPGNRGWVSLALDDQGRAHTLWLDHRALADAAGEPAHHAHEHAPAGAAIVGRVLLDPAYTRFADSVKKAQQSGLYYTGYSGTSGISGPRELVKGACYCCKTAFAAGARGKLFAAWRHVYPGNIRDIAFITSRDGGRTFGAAIRVSQDGWEIHGCPEDGPALAVDGRDTAHLAWPTVAPGADPYKAVFYASSADGVTFTRRVQISAPERSIAHPQIVVTPGGVPAVVWEEIVEGRRSVAASSRRSDGTFNPPARVSGAASATSPAIATLERQLLIAWRDGDAAKSVIAVRRMPSP